MTTSEKLYIHDLIEKMANPDQLSVIAALIPHLQHRQAVAGDYLAVNNNRKLQLIAAINEDIKKILLII